MKERSKETEKEDYLHSVILVPFYANLSNLFFVH